MNIVDHDTPDVYDDGEDFEAEAHLHPAWCYFRQLQCTHGQRDGEHPGPGALVGDPDSGQRYLAVDVGQPTGSDVPVVTITEWPNPRGRWATTEITMSIETALQLRDAITEAIAGLEQVVPAV